MATYFFHLERSQRPQDQVPGVVCSTCSIGGTVEAEDDAQAKVEARKFIPFAGRWAIALSVGGRELATEVIQVRGSTRH